MSREDEFGRAFAAPADMAIPPYEPLTPEPADDPMAMEIARALRRARDEGFSRRAREHDDYRYLTSDGRSFRSKGEAIEHTQSDDALPYGWSEAAHPGGIAEARQGAVIAISRPNPDLPDVYSDGPPVQWPHEAYIGHRVRFSDGARTKDGVVTGIDPATADPRAGKMLTVRWDGSTTEQHISTKHMWLPIGNSRCYLRIRL